MTTSDRRIREAFVELADTLTSDFDIMDVLDEMTGRCVDLVGVDAAGLLLVDHLGVLNLVAASTEEARLLELSQLQNSEGPCLEAYQSGTVVSCPDLEQAWTRWPVFTRAALDVGFVAVDAVPMRLRDDVIGAINVFRRSPGPLQDDDVHLIRALGGVASLAVMHQYIIMRHELVTGQLQTALDSRVLIEQAKGILAARLGISVDDAFKILRDHSRAGNHKLMAVAQAVIDGHLDIPAPGRQSSGG